MTRKMPKERTVYAERKWFLSAPVGVHVAMLLCFVSEFDWLLHGRNDSMFERTKKVIYHFGGCDSFHTINIWKLFSLKRSSNVRQLCIVDLVENVMAPGGDIKSTPWTGHYSFVTSYQFNGNRLIVAAAAHLFFFWMTSPFGSQGYRKIWSNRQSGLSAASYFLSISEWNLIVLSLENHEEFNDSEKETTCPNLHHLIILNDLCFHFQNEENAKCTIEEFAVYFLNFIRNQTEE